MTTAAIALENLLPRWRAKLPARYSPEYIDGFIARNRSALAEIVERAMMYRRVKQGTPPTTPEEFAAYGKLAERERPRDAEPDDVVLERITARLMQWKPRKRVAPDVAAVRYIEARAVAILLRRASLDAVPLLLREPATAILVDDQVVAVVDEVEREVAVASGYAGEERLRHTLFQTYQQLFEVTRDISEGRFERYAAALWARVRGASSTAAAPTVETPPDLQAKSWRTAANLKAMQLVRTKEPGEFTPDDLTVLAQYSGWGGLSIEGVKKIPKDLVPESFGLIHEYYTPTVIAKSMAAAICPLLPELAGNDGIVRALEPSAGIGRLIRAYSPEQCLALEAGGQVKKLEWTAVEFPERTPLSRSAPRSACAARGGAGERTQSMISFSDPKTLVGLHGMLTGWQSIRERRRMRYSPPAAASPSPPVSMHSPPVGAPPTPGPAGTVIAFHKLGDRILPIYGDPAEFGDAAARASANGAPSPSEARAAEAPAAPPQAATDASSDPQTPPPPDFTPQAVEASVPRRSPAAPPTLDLPPPTPPSMVRADEQAVTLERVLADHRVQLARQTEAQQALHAATMEAILAEHRRAQAQADHEHRQQLGELLAKHREEVHSLAQTTGEHGQALVVFRELLAEQASATQTEHVRIGEKIESIVDIVGMVGETVHHIAAVALQPKAPPFGALPTRPSNAAAPSVTDRPMQASPQPAITGAPRILPAQPAVQQPSPQPAPTVAAVAAVQPPVEQPAPTMLASHVAAQPTTSGASPAVKQDSPPLWTPEVSLGFTPAAAEVLTRTQTSTPTPRQLRAEAAARERSRLDDAVSDLTLDDSAESGDAPDASEAPHA